MAALTLGGSPATAGRRASSWRSRIAARACEIGEGSALLIDLTIEPRRWVDLDTLVEEVLAGLRAGGRYGRGYAGLDGFVATKRHGTDLGVRLETAPVDALPPLPSPAALDVAGVLPRPHREDKRRWRDEIAGAWAGPPLAGSVWCAVDLGTTGSLLSRLEITLDCLEPVLGRDPRGREWQAFFPNDDRITWLRVRRSTAAGVRLRLGPLPGWPGHVIDGAG